VYWCRALIWDLWSDFFTVGHLRASCCRAPSLTRGRVCNLLVQFAVTLRSKSRRTHDDISLSHLRLPQLGGPGPCIHIPREQGGPVMFPNTGFSFYLNFRLAGLRFRYFTPPGHGVDSVSQSNITTDIQAASPSWCQAPICDP
jgi:hypothetical protein